jgi:hypothetical protein
VYKCDFDETDFLYEHGKTIRRALEQSAAQAGWKLVPQEPTEAMIAAGAEEDQWTINEGQDTCAREIYKAMLAAAPSPPGHATDGKANEYGRRYQNH